MLWREINVNFFPKKAVLDQANNIQKGSDSQSCKLLFLKRRDYLKILKITTLSSHASRQNIVNLVRTYKFFF
jgi:hypothetical protein